MKKINALLLLAVACLPGCTFQVPLSADNFSTSPQTVTGNKLPISVGVLIEDGTKNWKKRITPCGQFIDGYGFSVGEELSKLILSASQKCFEKVEVVNSLPASHSKDFDAYLIVQDLKADIRICHTNKVMSGALLGAAGSLAGMMRSTTDASLSVSVRVADSNSNSIYSSSVVGNGSSDVPYGGLGPRAGEFSGGVNNAMQDLAKNLVQNLRNSSEIKGFANKASNKAH